MPGISQIMQAMDYGPANEDASLARRWLAEHEPGFGCFIAGAFTAPEALFELHDPATGPRLARVTQAGQAAVEAAVAAARAAQPAWAALSGHQRARHLYALARHLQRDARFLAALESLNVGKLLREARDFDLPQAIRQFDYHAGQAELVSEVFPGRAPWGVCAQIIPWSFPLLMLARNVAPALAAGNTVVLKPAQYTPLTALAFAEIAHKAGLPSGVINLVTGSDATQEALLRHPGVDKIAFTGATATGRQIRRLTAGSGKGLTLELGGKSPFIVLEGADLDAAVEGVVDALSLNQGQYASAPTRLLVAEAVADRFEALLSRRMAKLVTGDPLDKNSDLGPLAHSAQVARIRALLERGQAPGQSRLQGRDPLGLDGEAARNPGAEGCFLAPMVITGVEPASDLFQEEIFGPVATLTRFRTPEDALALANNSRYALTASIWSETIGPATEMAAKLRAGVIWVNAVNLVDAAAPFGGNRDSGFGPMGGGAGLSRYLRPALAAQTAVDPPHSPPEAQPSADAPLAPVAAIDRSAKLYIGGKQLRPDSGDCYPVEGAAGIIAMAPLGSRRDLYKAVDAAAGAVRWGATSGQARAQVLYDLAETLSLRADEFTKRLQGLGQTAAAAEAEVEAAIRRIFYYAARADTLGGEVVQTRAGHLTLTLNEPQGVVGVICPETAPLLGFVSLVVPLIACGNRVVALPSARHPLAATDLSRVFEASDLPAGVVNIVTGPQETLARCLAEHEDVDALWSFATPGLTELVEAGTAEALKPCFCGEGLRDWQAASAQGQAFLDEALRLKTLWLPVGG